MHTVGLRIGGAYERARARIFTLHEFRNHTLARVLHDYKHFPGLGVHWIMVGPSGHRTRPRGGGVLRHYTHCHTTPTMTLKMIVNTFYVAHAAGHPHSLEFMCASARRALALHTG